MGINLKIKEIKTMKSVLSKEIGWSWPIFLIKCLVKKSFVFRNTTWRNKKGPETQFIKRLSFAATLYLKLKEKFNQEKANEIIREVLIPIGCAEQWEHLRSLKVPNREPMEQLMAFNDLMDKKGAPQFNKREYVKQSDNICYFVITRCVFNDFFTETGTPELTKLFCEVDREFFPKAFPDFKFHRGSSWENTISCRKDHCEFIFEKNK